MRTDWRNFLRVGVRSSQDGGVVNQPRCQRWHRESNMPKIITATRDGDLLEVLERHRGGRADHLRQGVWRDARELPGDSAGRGSFAGFDQHLAGSRTSRTGPSASSDRVAHWTSKAMRSRSSPPTATAVWRCWGRSCRRMSSATRSTARPRSSGRSQSAEPGVYELQDGTDLRR